MMLQLSLNSLKLTEPEPWDILGETRSPAFDVVSLSVQAPPMSSSSLLVAEKEAECAAILADGDVEVVTHEGFELHSIEALISNSPQLN